MCTHSPESELYTRLNPQQHEQQGEVGDSTLSLSSGETTPGVLHPALEPPAQNRHGSVEVGTEEGNKNDPRAGAPLLCGKAERVGAVQPGGEKTAGRPSRGLAVPEGACGKDGENTFNKACFDRTRSYGFSLRKSRFRLDIRKTFL